MVREDKLSHKGFERLVGKALASLPEEFQDYLENVVVIIQNEPPGDIPDVMGLYEGVPLVERSVNDTILPDCITPYKRPIERACRTRAEIENEVFVAVLHGTGTFSVLKRNELKRKQSL